MLPFLIGDAEEVNCFINTQIINQNINIRKFGNCFFRTFYGPIVGN